MDIPERDSILDEYGPKVAAILKDLPLYPPDPRQHAFFKGVEKLRKEGFDGETLPMNGFPASSVDLGWIKDRGRLLVKELFDAVGPLGLSYLLEMLIEQAVQRVKLLHVLSDDERATLEIQINTRDDFGYYEYRMAVSLLKDDDLVQDQPPEE